MEITREAVWAVLQDALEVEHFTVPPYLSALFSLPVGENQIPNNILRSIVIEEMLHMVLVANVMNAIGGTPKLNYPEFVKRYPGPLPHCKRSFEVGVGPLSPDAVNSFKAIELPAWANEAKLPGEIQPIHQPQATYRTIGDMYTALETSLAALDEQIGPALWNGDPNRQITNDYYHGGAGSVIVVTDLASALQALEEIKNQGEGLMSHNTFGADGEPAHFYRFDELLKGKRYDPNDEPGKPTGRPIPCDFDQVYPMQPNPDAQLFPVGNPIRKKLDAFNQVYTGILALLENAFGGQPELLLHGVHQMFELKYLAEALMRTPLPDSNSLTVGPSFQFYPYSDSSDSAAV